jgi:hypothetical protein
MTEAVTCPAADRIACETTDEGLRQVTSETMRQTMYDTTMSVASRVAWGTMYEATKGTIPPTTLRVVSGVGESICELQA